MQRQLGSNPFSSAYCLLWDKSLTLFGLNFLSCNRRMIMSIPPTSQDSEMETWEVHAIYDYHFHDEYHSCLHALILIDQLGKWNTHHFVIKTQFHHILQTSRFGTCSSWMFSCLQQDKTFAWIIGNSLIGKLTKWWLPCTALMLNFSFISFLFCLLSN